MTHGSRVQGEPDELSIPTVTVTQAATPIKPLEAEFCRAAETEDRPRLCPADVPRLSTPLGTGLRFWGLVKSRPQAPQSIIRGHGLQVVSDVKYSGAERSATKQTENNRPQARKLLYTPSKPIGLLLNTAERAEA